MSLEAHSVTHAVDSDFSTSEQLPTRIWTAAGLDSVAGLLLQRMPDRRRGQRKFDEPDEDTWQRVRLLADMVTDREMLGLPTAQLLRRLFNAEVVRLQPPAALSFGC